MVAKVDSRAKGARIEAQIKKVLKERTGLNWERIPSSGALDAKHGLKGDLYVPGEGNLFCVEVKGYKEDHINSGLLTHKTPQIEEWVIQARRQGVQVGKKWLLIFKFDRSKIFVCFEEEPIEEYRYIYYSHLNVYMALLDDWLEDNPKFIKV
jgi:Holliday junction resolvase